MRPYFCLWCAVLLSFLVSNSVAGPGGKNGPTRRKFKPPLIEEGGRKKGPKQTHCHFGNKSYEIEERWKPDLGPPFGVLYCVRCECIPMQRKKKIVAKTRCENIKNVCPKPTCESPVLLPERCCKTCPGEDNTDIEEDLAMRKLESEDDDKNIKEFSVLLTGRGLNPTVPASGAARGYVTAAKRHLYYSILISGLARPSVVRFLDDDGSILEEHEVANPVHHLNGSKICGVWRKVPKVYRRLLQKERLSLALASETQPDGFVGGKILRNMRINKETFSSLMVPGSPKSKESLGGGGIAIISTEWNSIYLVLEFNGIFLPSDSRDVPVYVQLVETDDLTKHRTVASSVTKLPKVHPEYNAVNLKMNLSQEAQSLLGEGRLSLRLSARDDAMFLFGKITARCTCNVFQATMTQGNVASDSSTISGEISLLDSTSAQSTFVRGPAASTLVTLHPDGTIAYEVEAIGLAEQTVIVRLEREDPTTTDFKTLASSNETFLMKDKVSGVFPKSVQEVEMLLSEDLFLSLNVLQSPELKLSGRIRQRLYADAFVNELPMILAAESQGTPSPVGQAWLAVDKECSVHYAVYVAGLPIADASVQSSSAGRMSEPVDEKKRERHLVELIEYSAARSGPTQQRVLQRLNGEEAEDVQEDVQLSTLARINVGLVYLAVSYKIPGRGKTVELKAKIQNVPIPVTCLPRKEKSSGGSSYIEDESNDIYGEKEGNSENSCFYEGESFLDGAQWKAHHDHCMMCSCQRGQVRCDSMVCPPPPCENPVVHPGECCMICPGETPSGLNTTAVIGSTGAGKPVSRGCYFEGDKKFHVAGARWHPYIPPFGFSRCALCTCKAESLTVECKRITCPDLPCPEKEAFREHPLACCKQCPNTVAVKSTVIVLPGQMGDQGGKKVVNNILAVGGCRIGGHLYSNGYVWHPTVQPYGEMKCISCHCKDGRYRCKRPRCPKLSCEVRISPPEECCAKCLDDGDTRNAGGSTDRRVVTHKRKPRPAAKKPATVEEE